MEATPRGVASLAQSLHLKSTSAARVKTLFRLSKQVKVCAN